MFLSSFLKIFLYVLCAFLCFCVHDVFWCVLCVWAKLPEIKLDDDDDDDDDDIHSVSETDVGDQQMLITVLTNFQNFVDVPFISTCGRYPVHEGFPFSSSSFLSLPLARLSSIIPVSATASN